MSQLSPSLSCKYSPQDRQAFQDYFTPPSPKKRGRGRPAKKKSLRKRARRRLAPVQQKSSFDRKMESQVAGSIAVGRRQKQHRTNWDKAGNKELRERMAASWTNKNGMYKQGDSFQSFCDRVGIHTNSLRTYLKKLKAGNVEPKKRGRKALLSESVMRHLCEGM